jgi:ketosteroid isomerase-like protein
MKRIKVLFLLMLLSTSAGFSQHSSAKASHEKLIKDYYAAYEKKDWRIMENILAPGFTFSSPAGDDRINIKQYKEKCWPNALHTKKFDLEKIMIDGDDAFVTYNGWTTDGKLFRNTERFTFKDGKITTNECFFGTGVSFPNNTKK